MKEVLKSAPLYLFVFYSSILFPIQMLFQSHYPVFFWIIFLTYLYMIHFNVLWKKIVFDTNSIILILFSFLMLTSFIRASFSYDVPIYELMRSIIFWVFTIGLYFIFRYINYSYKFLTIILLLIVIIYSIGIFIDFLHLMNYYPETSLFEKKANLYSHGNSYYGGYRKAGYGGHPHVSGIILGLGLVLNTIFYIKYKKILYLFLIPFIISAMLLNGSRLIMASTFAIIIFYTIINYKLWQKQGLYRFIFFFMAIFFGATILTYTIADSLIGKELICNVYCNNSFLGCSDKIKTIHINYSPQYIINTSLNRINFTTINLQDILLGVSFFSINELDQKYNQADFYIITMFLKFGLIGSLLFAFLLMNMLYKLLYILLLKKDIFQVHQHIIGLLSTFFIIITLIASLHAQVIEFRLIWCFLFIFLGIGQKILDNYTNENFN